MMVRDRCHSSESGQVLVIVAAGLLAVVGFLGLIIDGGHAWVRARETQNGADAAAKAGAVIIQQSLAGASLPDGGVGCAIGASIAANDVTLVTAAFTGPEGNELGSVPSCGGGDIPAGAQGVKVTVEQQFGTFLAGVIGFDELKTSADATAVVGPVVGICPATAGCGTLPIAIPRTLDTCDDGGTTRVVGDANWPILNEAGGDVLSSANLAIIPLCAPDLRSVTGVELPGCGGLASGIAGPCNDAIAVPAWLPASDETLGCCLGPLQQYAGSSAGTPDENDAVAYLPIYDNTCASRPGDADPTCPGGNWSGTGTDLSVHVRYWVGFKIDAAIGQGDASACNGPGNPPAGHNTSLGCLKGWFVALVPAPGTVTTGDIAAGDPISTGILLIH